ncbi:hypothetical protein [Micromonospora sp. CPCC 206061]|uniref:hypothetical protein n=1 Tax=Micromonospora sp. CPCC 206061 TaxID=3122410 RepID=UPI002FF1A003
MLQLRLEGDEAEARAFLDRLRAGGAEVQPGGVRNRGAYSHVYAVVRMPGYEPPVPTPGPVRVPAEVSGRAITGRRRRAGGSR